MMDLIQTIFILIIVMVYIAVKLNRIGKILKDQSESLTRIAKHLEDRYRN